MAMTRVNLNDMLAKKIEMTAANSQGDMAKYHGQTQIGVLNANNAQALSDIALVLMPSNTSYTSNREYGKTVLKPKMNQLLKQTIPVL